VKLVITVEIDPRDCPEPKARLRGYEESVRKAVKESLSNALWVPWPSTRYPGVASDEAYRQPHIGRVSMAIEGPDDTFKGR
jgi:hypothetical protein